ncbi:MAG: glycerate kinase [Muribaculaceae bacterium]|nr:glycerate kinase [Muribaculaceae bacterium]
MKVVIAPDKFRGSLTAVQAAEAIRRGLECAYPEAETVLLPMADGGEGSAMALFGPDVKKVSPGIWQSTDGKDCCVVSAEIIGYDNSELMACGILERSSRALGEAIENALKLSRGTVYVCVGGTCTCDAGEGLLKILRPGFAGHDRVMVLSDVDVPLLSSDSHLDALSFVAQKGASALEATVLRKRLEETLAKYPDMSHCRFGGAGGGVGFALHGVLGLCAFPGAEYIINRHADTLKSAEMIISGEGCIDAQTTGGKVVSALEKFADNKGKSFVAFAGKVSNSLDGSRYIQVTPAGVGQAWRNAVNAAEYLEAAVRNYFS